jgi:hypothetical protein
MSRRINHPDPRNTYMFRTYGREPYQLELPGRERLVCGIHDYSEPDANGVERCPCGASRHKDSQI